MSQVKHLIPFLLFALPTLTMAQSWKDTTQLYATSKNGKSVNYQIPNTVAAKQPKWNGITNPPLPLSRAAVIALDSVKRQSGKPSASVNKIELKRKFGSCFSESCKIDFWYYKIETKTAPAHKMVSSRETQTVVILMDGSIVNPIISEPKFR